MGQTSWHFTVSALVSKHSSTCSVKFCIFIKTLYARKWIVENNKVIGDSDILKSSAISADHEMALSSF